MGGGPHSQMGAPRSERKPSPAEARGGRPTLRAARRRKAPWRGRGGERNQWHGRSRCLPPCPLGGGWWGHRSLCRSGSCVPTTGGRKRCLAAQPAAGAAQRRRRTSRCADQSAAGCADWRTFTTSRARAPHAYCRVPPGGGPAGARRGPPGAASWAKPGGWLARRLRKRKPAARAAARTGGFSPGFSSDPGENRLRRHPNLSRHRLLSGLPACEASASQHTREPLGGVA